MRTLTSGDSSFVTGIELLVDGGFALVRQSLIANCRRPPDCRFAETEHPLKVVPRMRYLSERIKW